MSGSSPLSRGIPTIAWSTSGGSGSSPLSRGIHRSRGRRKRRGGIIPALARNTTIPQPGYPNPGDHPRSRGEYTASSFRLAPVPGSSPLSRGIHDCGRNRDSEIRIIPALAGNTCQSARNTALAWDHPRSRGEYQLLWGSSSALIGSSPLSRGILESQLAEFAATRIIPALAGNTFRPWSNPR